jgi:hypothetical protein
VCVMHLQLKGEKVKLKKSVVILGGKRWDPQKGLKGLCFPLLVVWFSLWYGVAMWG